MTMPKNMRIALFFSLISAATAIQAADFFIFPVNELEGVSASIPPEKRPLIDKRVRDLLTGEHQAALLDGFSQKILASYPESTVHSRQVRDVQQGGGYRYINSPTCGEGFAVPVKRSYAVVIGLTRASWYEVKKERGIVELLIPITLNLQLIKPETSKVVYSVSQTLYSPFRFGSADELEKSKISVITPALVKGISQQVDGLVKELKNGFKPKDAIAKVVGRVNGLIVVNKGYESGFAARESPEAINQKTKKSAYFEVLSADLGYAVLKLTEGDAAVGDEFIFELSEGDDSSKPRVMPVTSRSDSIVGNISDFFAKDIGFKAQFQIAAVDVNFKDTQDAIGRQASCVPWDKYATIRQTFESRKDTPDYFLRFDWGKTPDTLESGLGGVETRESFATVVGVQLVDINGNVIFSEVGHDNYKLEKNSGRGLDIRNAYEVSLKNATLVAAKKFVENVKFQLVDFPITDATNDTFTVEGLAIPAGVKVPFEVIRPLGIEVNGRKVVWRMALDDDPDAPKVNGNKVTFKYFSADGLKVQRGDRIVVSSLPRKGVERMAECFAHNVGIGSVNADYILPFIRNAAFRSQKLQVTLSNSAFYDEANYLLREGKFKYQIKPEPMTDTCVRPGYLVKPEQLKCEQGSCAVNFLNAIQVSYQKGDQRVANFGEAEKISLSGVAEPQVANFTAFKAFESTSKIVQKLIDKLNQGK